MNTFVRQSGRNRQKYRYIQIDNIFSVETREIYVAPKFLTGPSVNIV